MTAESYFVVGGRQNLDDPDRPEWSQYVEALVLRVWPGSGKVEKLIGYTSPPEVYPHEMQASVLFKAATLIGGNLLVPTQTEVMQFDMSLPEPTMTGYLSLPVFNDVHHVTTDSHGRLVVVNTGLDMVLVVGWDGTVHEVYDVLGGDPWDRFSPDTDYRQVIKMHEHRAHPNFAFLLDGEIWVTRLEKKDAVCLSRTHAGAIAVGEQYLHDGVPHGGSLFFTTVDGRVIVVDAQARTVRRSIDLTTLTPRRPPLGWLRGIHVESPDTVVVGFTRLRRTRWMEKVAWVKYHAGRASTDVTRHPARIASYDISRQEMLWEANVEDHGMHAIFSIHPAERT